MSDTPTKKTGRPPKITLEVIEQIAKRIAYGMSEEQACLQVEVVLQSFISARKRNPEFARVVKKAQADYLWRALQAITEGGEVDAYGRKPWTGMAWILERRHKPQFNRTDTHAITDPQGGALMTDEEMRELSERTKARVLKGVKE